MDVDGLPDRLQYGLVVLRVMMGWIFLHAGLDKLESGIHYTYASVYLQEAAPIATPELQMTISHLIEFPLYPFVKAGAFIAEPLMQLFATWPFLGTLVILGELFVGVALILGVLTRLGGYTGAFFMFLFFYGNADWTHGFLNADLVYLVLFVLIAEIGAGQVYGLDERLREHAFVEKHPWLQSLLG